MKNKILFIGGSLNQTTMMHKISSYFNDCDCFFTSYYADGLIDNMVRKGFLDFTILAGKFREQTENYLRSNDLAIDYKGGKHNYDLVFTCQDLIIPKNIRNKRLVLIQEGMTEPENLLYHLVKNLKLPRWLASTSTTGLSDNYDLFFVASDGYRELFISKGVNPSKIRVTGIPNFDNASQYLKNDLPYMHYVLAATSDRRETYNFENRKKFIQKVVRIANDRKIIFKLHPNEDWNRATKEINKYAKGALVFITENTNHLVANCDILITRFSSVAYIGMALNKEVYSDYSMNYLRRLTPIQNNGTSAYEIAKISRQCFLENQDRYTFRSSKHINPVLKYVFD